MNSSDNFQDSALSRLMPLINSSFTPGQAQATVDNFQDPDQRQIAQAELYYFSGRAEECRNIAELYLQDKDLCLRLSAALLYSFSNLTLGNPSASRMGFRNIQECLRLAEENSASEEVMASCVFAGYLATVLMHLPAAHQHFIYGNFTERDQMDTFTDRLKVVCIILEFRNSSR